MKKADQSLAEFHMREVLRLLGHDTEREGLRETPKRYVKFLQEFCKSEPYKFTTFDAEGYHSMLVEAPIPFASLCEHHLAPFVGHAYVAYIPDKRIAGLSKIPRTVRHYASRLQNQERLTKQIAEGFAKLVETANVAVVLRATHSCMEIRGVRAAGVVTTTSCLMGAFDSNASTRAEFLAHLPPVKA
jgi:GTP cyclohydrolase IA